MQKAFLLFCFICISPALFSQSPFEGKVTYLLKKETENDTAIVELYYGKLKVKGIMRVPGKEDEDTDDLLIDFEKGIMCHINPVKKTYRVDSLNRNSAKSFFALSNIPVHKKRILDQPCSAVSVIDSSLGGLIGNIDLVFWYADSLYYPVDGQYLNSNEMPLFTDGKNIGMGMSVSMENNGTKRSFGLEAKKIEWMKPADSLFEIPRGYQLKLSGPMDGKHGQAEPGDVKLSEVKTEAAPPPPPPPPPSKKKKKGRY